MAVEKSVAEPDGLRHRKQKEKVQKHSISSFKDTGNGSTCSRGIWNWLADPIDPISISLFRVLFSFGMAWHMVVLLRKNTLRANFLFPELNFHYPLCRYCFDTPSFEYVVLISLTALLSSVTMMIGLFTKFSATIFLITYVWLNALEKSRYNNHYYFYANLAFLLTMTGSGQKMSIDSFFRKKVEKNVVPRWNLCILQFIIVVCYFYAGIAKMNYDWFIRGEPMTSWLYDKEFFKDYPLHIAKVMGYFTSLGGLVFDTFIGFVLLSKLKYFGFFLTAIFHISNHFLFQIGTFPWVMLATNILFVSPEFINKLFLKFKLISSIPKQEKSEHKTSNDNNHSTENKTSHHSDTNNSLTEETSEQNISWKAKFFLGCFVGYHLVMPLRHWVYNTEHSSVNWTMTGHQFSWRMMLNDEDVLLRLHAKLDINSDEEVTQNIYQMRMNARQVKRMITDLDLILQFIKHCKSLSPGTKDSPAHIRIDLWKALNGRPYQRWVDPDIYLNQRSPDDWSQDWIRPMLPDNIIDFEELEKIKLKNLDKSIGTSFFMEGKNETFSTSHHKRAGCKIINVTCLQGELFYKQEQHDEEKKLLPGMKINIPLDTSYRLYTMESTAVWMYEHDCHVGFFHAGMQMLSTQGWGVV